MAVAVPCSDGIAVALRVGMGTDTAPDIGHLRREHGVDVQRIHQDPDHQPEGKNSIDKNLFTIP